MTRTCVFRLFLALVCLLGSAAALNAQRFTIECKDRYFLGEPPTIKIAITNTGRSRKTVKQAEYRKFDLEMTGLFSEHRRIQKKNVHYDGTWYFPEQPASSDVIFWMAPVRIRPKYVRLEPGESTTLSVDLARTFGSDLGVSNYRLKVKSADGQTIVTDFEVYFDEEKTIPILAEMLETGNTTGWAVYYLKSFNRPRFITLLEELAARNEKRRAFATGMLSDIRAGNFDALQLRVKSKERYSLYESPVITISLESNLGTPQMVIPPQYQRFSLELIRVSPNEPKQEVRTYVYTPKETPQRPGLVTIPSYGDSAGFDLNLQEFFGARLERGDYELIVKSLDQQELKYQIAVQKFQIVNQN
jgi:hypothetical protein